MSQPRFNVRVFPATQRTTKNGRVMYLQSCQIDQEGKPSLAFSRRYFDESKVMSAGQYTAAVSLYSVQTRSDAGYADYHICISCRDFQPA